MKVFKSKLHEIIKNFFELPIRDKLIRINQNFKFMNSSKVISGKNLIQKAKDVIDLKMSLKENVIYPIKVYCLMTR